MYKELFAQAAPWIALVAFAAVLVALISLLEAFRPKESARHLKKGKRNSSNAVREELDRQLGVERRSAVKAPKTPRAKPSRVAPASGYDPHTGVNWRD